MASTAATQGDLIKNLAQRDATGAVAAVLAVGNISAYTVSSGATASSGQMLIVTDASTVTLPSSPSNGNTVIVVNATPVNSLVAPASGGNFRGYSANATVAVAPGQTRAFVYSTTAPTGWT